MANVAKTLSQDVAVHGVKARPRQQTERRGADAGSADRSVWANETMLRS